MLLIASTSAHVLYLLCSWLLALHPNAVDQTPLLWWLVKWLRLQHAAGENQTSVRLALHLPKTRHAAWLLGYLTAQVWEGNPSDNPQDHAALLAQATRLLGLPDSDLLTPQHLTHVGQLLASADSSRGPVSTLLGLLSIVNLLWLAGIVGVCVTVGPAMYYLFEPIIKAIWQLCSRFLLSSWAVLCRLAQLFRHTIPLLALAACLLLVVAANIYPAVAAAYIALTGHGLAIAVVCQEVVAEQNRQHEQQQGNSDGLQSDQRRSSATTQTPARRPKLLNNFLTLLFSPTFRVNCFAALALASAAVAHQSQLCGFLAVTAWFAALGFVVIPFGCGWSVGWGSVDDMLRCELASGSLLLGLLLCRLLLPSTSEHVQGSQASSWQLIQPFRLGVSVFGGVCLFLAGLIRSSKWYSTGRSYWISNTTYLLLILASIAVGALAGLTGLHNTALTFLILWVSQKAIEVTAGRATWIAMFALSLTLWRCSLYLTTHPGWLASLLDL